MAPPTLRKRRVRTSNMEAKASVRKVTVGKKVSRHDISRQEEDSDVFTLDGTAGEGVVIRTPFDMGGLHNVHEKSNILRQCIQAYVTNIASNGYRVVPIDEGTEIKESERRLLQSFIDSPNTEESLATINGKNVAQYEKYGFSFLEIIRDRAGNPSLIKSVKSANTRILTRGSAEVTVTMSVERGGKRSRVQERKRFRRYLQQTGTHKIYYKEYGDPRDMDYKTGRYATAENPVAAEDRATEVLHNRQFSEDAYGIPRWISMLPSILGSREAEEVNMRYFEDNTVPPMILSVAGGRLTKQSYIDLRDTLSGVGVGKERQNQIMLLEAVPEVTDIDGKGSVQLKVDKLTDSRQGDGLFKEYDEANMAKVRSAFRLPPVFLGMSQDMTFATANVSAYLAEVQVFSPERRGHDEFMNKKFVNHPLGLGLKTCKLESRGPSITNPEQVVKTMTAMNVMGGVTPRAAIDVANETLQLSLPQYPEKDAEGYMEWMDQPMPLTQATSKSQQTGEGKTTHAGQESKDQDIKDREGEGDIEPSAVEHGSE